MKKTNINLITHIRTYITILFISIIITSCITTSMQNLNHSPDYIYKSSQKKLKNKNYKGAIQDLMNLQKLYLFDPYPQQIHLNLIYAYYKINDLKSSNDSIQHFLQLYPNHKHLDYVLYMHGLVNMTLDQNNTITIIKHININWNDRNPIYANIAFRSFMTLVYNYPNSPYTLDAYKRLIYLKNRIAEYELAVIRFYNKKNAYISVITRTEKMLLYFPDTQATHQALIYMHKAYQNMHLYSQANKIKKIININLHY